MKKLVFLLPLSVAILSCTSPQKNVAEEQAPAASSIALPYEATFSSQFNQDVSDEDLLTVLNSYKAWETGDMPKLRSAFGDSLNFTRWDGTKFNGPASGTLDNWAASRDSLSSVKLVFAAWLKCHSIDTDADFINVWYKEIDTYKSGKVDSADWHDINSVKNGKIRRYFQYRRGFKVK